MSIRIIKAGISDSIQDLGRYGFQHLGINPGGVMDVFSAKMANLLAGNEITAPVIEMHFPASALFFEKPAIISITGANFSPILNGESIPINHPVYVNKNSLFEFSKWEKGARCYVAIQPKLIIQKWLDSYSTNRKAKAGGYEGRSLRKEDVIRMEKDLTLCVSECKNDFYVIPFSPDLQWTKELQNNYFVLPGPEWDLLSKESKELLVAAEFTITKAADRMGYRLNGPFLSTHSQPDILSSGVEFGTIQLLPDGQLIILMAGHQTTGGYPRIANIISTSLPPLAQSLPGTSLSFSIITQEKAERLFMDEKKYFQQIQSACHFRLTSFLNRFSSK